MVQYSMKIIEQFSYLFDVEVFIDRKLIVQLEQILITFNDMNTNKINFYFYKIIEVNQKIFHILYFPLVYFY